MCVALTGVLAPLAACHSGLLVTLKPEEQTLPLCVWIGSGTGDTDTSDVPQGTERHLRPWDRALVQSVAGTGTSFSWIYECVGGKSSFHS